MSTITSNTSNWRSWPLGLVAKTFTLLIAALLFSAGAARGAGLVLEVKPADYNTGTLQWPIAAGTMAGDYFACAPWAPVSVATKVYSGDGLSYKAVDFTAAGSILGGPLCPASLGGANPRTIEAWCYQPTGANGDAMTIIDLSRQGGPDNSNFAFVNSLYNRSIWSPPYIEGWNASNAQRSGNWVHLVASYDGTTLNLYFNGTPDKTGIAHTFATESGGSISIGMMRYVGSGPDTTPHSTSNADGWNSWRGYLGAIRVYDEARTAGQVASDYALGVNYGEVGVGMPKITASVSGGHGAISPSGTVYVTPGNNQAFTFTPDLGYKVSDVLVDGVSNPGAVLAGSYTFTGVTADHTIVVSFEELPKQTVSGKVTDGAVGILGAKVYFKTSPNASVSPTYTTTTVDAAGNYSYLLPPGTWYATANELHYFTPADVTFTVAASPVPLADIVLTANPNWAVLFCLNTDDLSAIADGDRIFNWAGYVAYQTYNNELPLLGPTVETIGGVKWEKNVRSPYNDSVPPTVHDRGDGFNMGTSASDILTEGVTIIAVVKPQYKVMSGEVRGEIVDIFYQELFLAVNHGNGEVIVCTRGYAVQNTGYFIPDGQKTILSLVVAPAGGITLFANGEQKWTYASGVDYTSLKLSWSNTMGVGRNTYDGWSAFNGNIGDVCVYKTAKSNAERSILEGSLAAKFGISIPYTITASTGPNGTISPSGSVSVAGGASQHFEFLPDSGYQADQVTIDSGTPTTASPSGYTFPAVSATHTIHVTFKVATVTHTITASAGANGTINPSGSVVVADGASQHFNFLPDSGYVVDQVTIDSGTPVAANPVGYTFTGVTADHSIAITFKPIPPVEVIFRALSSAINPLDATTWPLDASYNPSVTAMSYIGAGTPAVETLGGQQWEKNQRADGFWSCYRVFHPSASIPISGATIVVAIMPVRNAIEDPWDSIVDVMYDKLVLAIRNGGADAGKLIVRRNGGFDISSAAIPDGEKTLLSLVCQIDGSYEVWANGVSVMTGGASGTMTEFDPARIAHYDDPDWAATAALSGMTVNTGNWDQWWAAMMVIEPTVTAPWDWVHFNALPNRDSYWGYDAPVQEFKQYINVGRNQPDGWPTFNGNIGDAYLYGKALSPSERQALESSLSTKFGIGATVPTVNITSITANPGTGDLTIIGTSSKEVKVRLIKNKDVTRPLAEWDSNTPDSDLGTSFTFIVPQEPEMQTFYKLMVVP